ncbi:MAG: DUF3592 domain-containing protein [Chloroflexota bacterium]
MPATRNDWLAFSMVSLVFAGLLLGILAIQQGEIRAYRNRGIETSASVVFKGTRQEYSSSTDSSTTIHYIDVTFFDKSEVADSESETTVDLLEGEFEFGEINIGEFQRSEAEITKRSYDAIEVGDDVSVLYLPNSPDEAKLTEEVLNFRPTFLYALIGLCGLGLLYTLIRAVGAPKAKPPSEFQEVYP